MGTQINTIERTDADERKLAEIFKHPIGIILLYVQAAFGMILAIGLAYFLLPVVLNDTNTAFMIGNIFAFISVTLAFLVIVVATFLYRQNRLIITDRNITQILQFGLFSRKVSQLNMNNVEDVTAVQSGVLATIFNFGVLKIETAGEQVNFHYTFCPNAGYYAKIILDCREAVLGQMDSQTFNERHSTIDMPESSQPMTAAQTQKTTAAAIKDLGAETVKRASSNNQ